MFGGKEVAIGEKRREMWGGLVKRGENIINLGQGET